MKKLLILFFVLPTFSLSQNYGDFRTIASGYWSDYETTWQMFDGSNWTAAPWQPGASDEVITIRSGHTVTTDFWCSYTDQCIIESGATLIVEGTQFKISNGPGTDLDVYGTLVVNGTIATNSNSSIVCNSGSTIIFGSSGQISNNGNFTLSSGATLKTANPSGINGSITTGGTKSLNNGATYEFNGTSSQVTGTLMPSTVYGLTINNSSAVTLSQSTTVTNLLNLMNGLLLLGSSNLTLGTSATVSGTPSASNMVVISGSGEMRKEFSNIGSFIYPIGDNSGTAEYSPVTLNFTSGTFSSAYCGVKVINSKHPNNSSSADFLNRYWTITQSGISNYTCSITLTYVDADINGNENNLYCGQWDGSVWTLHNVTNVENNQLTATVTSLSDFTGGESSVLPIELVSFTANMVKNKVILEWKTLSEINNYGFYIERRLINSDNELSDKWLTINFIKGAGTTNNEKLYSFVDGPGVGKYVYRLKQVDNDGTFKYSANIEVVVASPTISILFQNYPNPFNPRTEINYQLSEVSIVLLKVYDVLGKEVATLVDETKEAGHYTATFDASHLSSGIYFARLTVTPSDGSKSYFSVKKMLLTK